LIELGRIQRLLEERLKQSGDASDVHVWLVVIRYGRLSIDFT
jgi:hypothetical protein